jgi:Protein of unknown function (DUF4238)
MPQSTKRRQLKPRQHTVSKFYLRRFAVLSPTVGEPDGFWVYRRGQGLPRWLPAEAVCIHSHFYSYVDETGTRNPEMEELLAEVESAVAPVVQTLVASGLGALTERERRRLVFFVAAAYARTPAMRRTVVAAMEQRTLAKLKELAADEAQLRASVEKHNAAKGGTLSTGEAREYLTGILSGDAALKLRDKAQIAFPLLAVVPLCAMLLQMHWRLLRAPAGCEFVTSDNPVVLAGPGAVADPFKDGGLEVTLPLDPQHCLLLVAKGPAVGIPEPSSCLLAQRVPPSSSLPTTRTLPSSGRMAASRYRWEFAIRTATSWRNW